jgi:hypothetical protein
MPISNRHYPYSPSLWRLACDRGLRAP